MAKNKVKVEKVVRCGIVREDGFLYFIDIDGDISRMKMPQTKKPSDYHEEDYRELDNE
jgi:hypothetical protein